MRLAIDHRTEYRYEQSPPYALQELRLTPLSDSVQRVLAWRLTVDGGRIEAEFTDQHGNRVSLASFDAGIHKFCVHCEGEVETESRAGVIGPHRGPAPLWYFTRSTALTKAGPQVRKLVRTLGSDFDGDIARLHALMDLVADLVGYESGHTHSGTTAEEALEAGHGVCQDQAHVFISAARLMGFPARYVSGYLMMEERVEQEASHAWAEAYVDGLGWVGFDVSNRMSPDDRYLRVATGLDYKEAAPISGMRLGDSGEAMFVSLQVQQ